MHRVVHLERGRDGDRSRLDHVQRAAHVDCERRDGVGRGVRTEGDRGQVDDRIRTCRLEPRPDRGGIRNIVTLGRAAPFKTISRGIQAAFSRATSWSRASSVRFTTGSIGLSTRT